MASDFYAIPENPVYLCAFLLPKPRTPGAPIEPTTLSCVSIKYMVEPPRTSTRFHEEATNMASGKCTQDFARLRVIDALRRNRGMFQAIPSDSVVRLCCWKRTGAGTLGVTE